MIWVVARPLSKPPQTGLRLRKRLCRTHSPDDQRTTGVRPAVSSSPGEAARLTISQ
jgi:hypothetical protein